jgi:phosphatidylglycerophosphate synthase
MTAERINDSVLGRWERPLLAWLVARLPRAVTPDGLTVLGLTGACLAGTGFVLSRDALGWLWLANLGIVLNWVGDSLDGNLARHRGIGRPRYGFFIDHTTDLFAQVLIFLALGASPLAHFGTACLGLIAFLALFVYTLIVTHTRATMRITYLRFGPTEIRALLLGGNLLTLAAGVIDVGRWLPALRALGVVTLHDAALTVLALVGFAVAGTAALGDGRVLRCEDPPRE